MKKLSFSLLTVLIFVLCIECLSALILYQLNHFRFQYDVKNFNKNSFLKRERVDSELNIFGSVLSNQKLNHPYFGYYFEPENNTTFYTFDINGFFGEIKLPYEKNEKDFVIAIQGGSVAQGYGSFLLPQNIDSLKKTISKYFKDAFEKEVKVIVTAQGGLKQPQQFLITTLYSEYIDLFINIEGLNEFDIPYPRFPAYYPSGAEHYFRYLNQDLHGEIFKLRFLSEVSDDIWFVNNLQSLQLAWFLFNKYASNRLLEIFHEINTNYKNKSIFSDQYLKNKNKVDLSLSEYKKFSIKQNSFTKSNSSRSIFILQPNQVLESSKPFSKLEKEKFMVKNSELYEFYIKLGEFYKKMNAKGEPFYNFQNIFREEPRTIYVDNCCHLNDLGNEIMHKQLLEVLKLEGAR